MLLTRVACVAALASVSCCASIATVEPPDDAPQVTKYSCEMDKADAFGAAVKVGDVVMTAHHVVDGCLHVDGYAFPDVDLAILTPGELPSCRAPEEGERVTFTGYPTTKRNGDSFEFIQQRRLERTVGTVMLNDQSISMIDAPTGTFYMVYNHSYVDPIAHLRPGYSGGAVTALDGEFLGIISTGTSKLNHGSFVPANVICEKLELIL